MSQFDYINKYYGTDFKRGVVIKVDGKRGRVTSADGRYLMVRFDGEKKSVSCHPTWKVEILEEVKTK